MIKDPYIEFRKKREIGEIITDTFKFLRRNFKDIFAIVIRTAGIPFLLLIAAAFYNSYSSLKTNPEDFGNPFSILTNSQAILSSLVLYLMIFIYFSFLYAGVLSCIKSYIQNKGAIIREDVLANVRQRSMSVLGTGMGKFLLLFIAWMLCVLPGVFIFAPLALIFPIFIFENKGFSESLSGSFTLIKEDWVMSAIAIAFGFVIWYLISLVFSLPLMIYFFVKMLAFVQEGDAGNIGTLIDMPFVILTALASLMQYLAYLFMPIVAAFVYYNLNERKNQTGSLNRIDTIGSDNA